MNSLDKSWEEKAESQDNLTVTPYSYIYLQGASDFQEQAISTLLRDKIQDCECSEDKAYNEGLNSAIFIIKNLKAK